jgi:hypothetical protein
LLGALAFFLKVNLLLDLLAVVMGLGDLDVPVLF